MWQGINQDSTQSNWLNDPRCNARCAKKHSLKVQRLRSVNEGMEAKQKAADLNNKKKKNLSNPNIIIISLTSHQKQWFDSHNSNLKNQYAFKHNDLQKLIYVQTQQVPIHSAKDPYKCSQKKKYQSKQAIRQEHHRAYEQNKRQDKNNSNKRTYKNTEIQTQINTQTIIIIMSNRTDSIYKYIYTGVGKIIYKEQGVLFQIKLCILVGFFIPDTNNTVILSSLVKFFYLFSYFFI
ncbi:hypothetical protein ABPG72_020118 [Tetrahymena utriculariae]